MIQKKKKAYDFYQINPHLDHIVSLFRSNILNLKFIIDNTDYDYMETRETRDIKIKSRTYYSLCQKISKKKIVRNSIEIQFLFELLEKRKNFQDKFLFILFLIIRKFYQRLSTEMYELYEKNIQKSFFSVSMVFFFNFLPDFLPNTKNFRKRLNINWENIIKEVITVIGPNRDFFRFNFKKCSFIKKK